MQFTDILSFCFSILGLYGLVYYLRFLIPRNLLPCVSAVLTEAEHLLDRAESTGVIPRPNDYRSDLTLYEAVMPLPMDGHLLILTVIPINSCGFGWKAIVLLE
jgi:hypothetical protein